MQRTKNKEQSKRKTRNNEQHRDEQRRLVYVNGQESIASVYDNSAEKWQKKCRLMHSQKKLFTANGIFKASRMGAE